MFIGSLKFSLYLPGVRSLKEKRRIISSLKEHLRHRYNISISEVDCHDYWQRASLGIAYVSNSVSVVEQFLHDVINFVHKRKDIEIITCERDIHQATHTEILHFPGLPFQ